MHKKPLYLASLLILLLGIKTPCFASKIKSDSLEIRMDAILKNYTGKDRPGATIGIIDHGKLVFQKGYGMADLEKKVPNHPHVVYKIASVSKQFTAYAVSQLIRQNKLSLNDDIRKYIPEFPDYGKPVSVGNLLYHTSGIRDYMVLMWLTGKSFEDVFSNQEALKIINRQSALNFTPGHRCVYSNSNYILLAELVKRITGKSLNDYVHENLFKGLKMNHSGFTSDKHTGALSYKKNENKYTPYRNDNHTAGDGGMFTTLADLAKWDQEFYDSTSINQDILKRGTLENGNILSYGRGIMFNTYRAQTIQTHPGAFLGYRSEILRFPKQQITIILLGNSEDINPEVITRKIADAYVFKDKTNPAKDENPVNPLPDNYKNYKGKYEVAPNVFIDIREEDNKMIGQVSGQAAQTLYYQTGNTFKIGNTNDKAVFNSDSLGKIFRLDIVQNQGTTKAVKLEFISGDLLSQFAGTYYSDEQKSSYAFDIQDGVLWFKVGSNPKAKAEIIKKYEVCYFSYQNLEFASIKFNRDTNGTVTGFELSSGRVAGLKFDKK
jgi:CubicO group peptidase (beta-lactamase class C family)